MRKYLILIKWLYSLLFTFSILAFSTSVYAEVVEYHLNINKIKVNFSGKETTAISINNSIPGPAIKAKIRDTLRIAVTNNLNVETSIHWHGVLVPHNMDGVPYVNTRPIHPGETFTYEYPIKHSGTYWYHAHSALQEQSGVYGSMVFYPKHEIKDYDEEHVLVLSDWTDENPDKVLANIKKDPDYYALKKDSVQSWLKVLKNGSKAIKIRINNAFTRMGFMDMSDIGYDAFLINGKKSSSISKAKPGTRIKLRIINAAASSYFVFEYSGGLMKVIETDGVKLEPFTTNKVRIAMAETYDVIVTVPQNKTYEFRASSEDGTGFATAHIGQGDLISASTYPKPNLVLMGMNGMDHSSMRGPDMSNMQKDGWGNASKHEGMDMSPAKSMESMSNIGHMMHQDMKMNKEPVKTDKIKNSKEQNNEGQHMMDHSAHKGMVMEKKQINNNAGNKMQNMDMSGMDHSMASKEVVEDTSSNMDGLDHSASQVKNMDMPDSDDRKKLRHVDFLNNYKELKSRAVSTLPQNNPKRTVILRLTGSMERYIWTVNNTPMYAADKIVIKKGENVKFILINETMMHHPIHLHGHFFRVLNGQGDYSPLKHTVNVAPFETVEIEFEANEEKDWIFHCHNLYHMKLGMGGVVHYEGSKDTKKHNKYASSHSSEHGNIWFNATRLDGYSNFANLTSKFMRNNDNIMLEARHDYKKDYEGELLYQRYLSQFLGVYIGGAFEKESKKISNRGIVGIEYTLPLLIKADLRINTEDKVRFGLANEHVITDRVSFDWKWNTKKEYTLGVNYAITKQFYISGNYDSKEKFGIGLSIKF